MNLSPGDKVSTSVEFLIVEEIPGDDYDLDEPLYGLIFAYPDWGISPNSTEKFVFVCPKSMLKKIED